MGGHSAGVRKKVFCAQRKKKCKDGQKYRDNCKVSWGYQAHHILCVASVTQFLAKKRKILPVIEQTKWCINEKPNMLAMPLWGTVTKYYIAQLKRGDFTAEPDFANIPVHSYNHNSPGGYKSEVDDQMSALAKKVEESKEKHEDASNTLKGDLDSIRDDIFAAELERRGSRARGTHREWLEAYGGNPASNWYEPFSMAIEGSIEPRTFPMRKNRVTIDKVLKLIKSLW